MNSETYFNAVTPAITEQYSHPAYKTLGEIDYKQGETTGDILVVLGSNYAVNNSDQEQNISLTISGDWQESQTTTSSVTSGMSFSAEVSLEGIFKSGSTFSTSVTAGESNTQSRTRTSSASATVKVPPKSKIKVSMVGTMKTQTMNFTAPIQVSGMFGANFPDRVSDHYFWFADVEQVLPKTSGILSGTVKDTAAFNVQTEIGEAEPL